MNISGTRENIQKKKTLFLISLHFNKTDLVVVILVNLLSDKAEGTLFSGIALRH